MRQQREHAVLGGDRVALRAQVRVNRVAHARRPSARASRPRRRRSPAVKRFAERSAYRAPRGSSAAPRYGAIASASSSTTDDGPSALVVLGLGGDVRQIQCVARAE